MVRIFLGLLAIACAATLAGACKGSAVGVDVCRQIEDALCARAPSCGIDIGADGTPRHASTESDVQACQQFYYIGCLHGLETAVPSAEQVTDCVDAINTQSFGCDGGTLITEPQTVAIGGVCAWLVPAVVTTVDAAAADASSDAETSTTPPADAEVDDTGLVIISM